MEYQIYTYYETLKRKYKDQNDEGRAKKKGATDLRLKRDQRVRAVCKVYFYVDRAISKCQAHSFETGLPIIKS